MYNSTLIVSPLEPVSMQFVLAVGVCAFAGSFVTAVSGVGGALTFQAAFYVIDAFMPLRSIKVAIAYSVFRSTCASPVSAWFSRKHISRAMLFPMLPALAIGAPVGQLIVQSMDIRMVSRFLGTLCLLVIFNALRKRHVSRPRGGLAAADACATNTYMNRARADDEGHQRELAQGGGQGANASNEEASESGAASLPPAAAESGAGEQGAAASIPPAAAEAGKSSARLIALCAATGLATGVIGAGFGAPGIPFMVLASYITIHKTTLRGLLSAHINITYTLHSTHQYYIHAA